MEISLYTFRLPQMHACFDLMVTGIDTQETGWLTLLVPSSRDRTCPDFSTRGAREGDFRKWSNWSGPNGKARKGQKTDKRRHVLFKLALSNRSNLFRSRLPHSSQYHSLDSKRIARNMLPIGTESNNKSYRWRLLCIRPSRWHFKVTVVGSDPHRSQYACRLPGDFQKFTVHFWVILYIRCRIVIRAR